MATEKSEIVKDLLHPCADWDGRPMADNETPIYHLTCGQVRAAADRIEALEAENERLRALLQDILIADTEVVEGSSDKPVVWYGLCAGMVKEHVNLSRDETLRLVRIKTRAALPHP